MLVQPWVPTGAFDSVVLDQQLVLVELAEPGVVDAADAVDAVVVDAASVGIEQVYLALVPLVASQDVAVAAAAAVAVVVAVLAAVVAAAAAGPVSWPFFAAERPHIQAVHLARVETVPVKPEGAAY